MTFGEFAKQRLRRLGKSQKALATKLGVSPAYVSQIFTGKKNPPDLGRPRNRWQLRIWADFLDADEDDLLDLIRFQLHRIPPPPIPKFDKMRKLLLTSLKVTDAGLADEIRAMQLHPAENQVIQAMIAVYLAGRDQSSLQRAFGITRFRDMCVQARTDSQFVETELVEYFETHGFSWTWDSEANDVRFIPDSPELSDAVDKVEELLDHSGGPTYSHTVPVVGHVSAGEGFEYTDGGFPAGEGFEHVEIPPGIDPALARRIYCVRVRGDSLQPFFGDGALLFIKPESWEEIKDGDLVIFKDRDDGKAFVKKVEFAGENLILRSLNERYRNLVLARDALILLEKVRSVVFSE